MLYTGVYGPHTNIEREELWSELGAIRGIWPNQWVIRGDFNVCRFENERLNCVKRSRAMRNFSNVIQDLCLVDLPLQGTFYTWTRGEDIIQASRIDRFFISNEWNDSFSKINQIALPNVISDHIPLMLECGDRNTNPSYFKCENIWLGMKGFMNKVKAWWAEL